MNAEEARELVKKHAEVDQHLMDTLYCVIRAHATAGHTYCFVSSYLRGCWDKCPDIVKILNSRGYTCRHTLNSLAIYWEVPDEDKS